MTGLNECFVTMVAMCISISVGMRRRCFDNKTTKAASNKMINL